MILVRGWLYCNIIFSLLIIFGEGVIISWHHIFTPDDIGDGVIILWHYIFTPDNIWWGVIISWHYIFTPGNIWWGCDYIVTLYFHSWQYLVRGGLYHDTVFSLLIIFGEGLILSWHIFTPEDIWWGGDYIVTLHYHSWHYPRIWHWRWLYLNIFTIQIGLCSQCMKPPAMTNSLTNWLL